MAVHARLLIAHRRMPDLRARCKRHDLVVAPRALLANRLSRRHRVVRTVHVVALFAAALERLVRELRPGHPRLEIVVTSEAEVWPDRVEQLREARRVRRMTALARPLANWRV